MVACNGPELGSVPLQLEPPADEGNNLRSIMSSSSESKMPSNSVQQCTPASATSLAAVMCRHAVSHQLQDSFEQLRSQHSSLFARLCKIHLSFLIEVPPNFLEGDSDAEENLCGGNESRWHGICDQIRCGVKMKLLAAASTGNSRASAATPKASSEDSSGFTLRDSDDADLREPAALLALLSRQPAIEGLFRKCGSAVRQRRLRDRLQQQSAVTHPPAVEDLLGIANAHDIVGALKAALADLSEPLLTGRLLPYFQRAAALTAAVGCAGNTEELAVRSAKRLKAFRLLVHLLPSGRRAFLARLLTVVGALGLSGATKMSGDGLGTVFGPLLFYPPAAEVTATDAREMASAMNSAAGYLIENADSVTQIPESTAIDAHRTLLRLHQRQSPHRGDFHPSAASVRFAAPPSPMISSSSSSAADCGGGSDDYTRRQLAALYAAVQAMPDSAKKRQLSRRLQQHQQSRGAAGGIWCEISSPVLNHVDFPTQGLSPPMEEK